MEDHNKHIDDLFKKGLGDYTEVPPPAVWDALEKRLDEKQKRRGGYYPWFISLLLLSCLTLLGGAIWKLNEHQSGAGTAKLSDKTIVASSQSLNNLNCTIEKNKEPHIVNNSKDIKNTVSTKDKQQLIAGETTQMPYSEKAKGETGSIDKIGESNKPKTKNNTNPVKENEAIASNTAEKGFTTKESEQVNNLKTTANRPEKDMVSSETNNSNIKAQPSSHNEIAVNKNEDGKKAALREKGSRILPHSIKMLPAANRSFAAAMPISEASIANALPAAAKQIAIIKQGPEKGSRIMPHPIKILPAASSGFASAKPLSEVSFAGALPATKHIADTKQNAEKQDAGAKHSTEAENKGIGEDAIAESKENDVSKKQAKENNPQTNKEYASLTGIQAKQFPFEKTYTNTALKEPAKEMLWEDKPIVMNSTEKEAAVGTFKENAFASSANGNSGSVSNAMAAENAAHAIGERFEAGVKVGFEGGFDNSSAKKMVGSFYIQYNMGLKIALMLQPSIKVNHVNNQAIKGSQTFYKENTDSSYSVSPVTPITVTNPETGQVDTTLWTKTYTFSQTHDSIVKSYSYGGTNMEVELPILMKYNINGRLSVYGGINIIYNKTFGISENTYTVKGILKQVDTLSWWPFGGPVPPAPSANSVLKYTGTPISSYSGPLYSSQGIDMLRIGYMLGVSYEFKKRWLVDLLMQQGSARPNVQGGYDVNSSLASPYLRVTIGYKLGKMKIPFLR